MKPKILVETDTDTETDTETKNHLYCCQQINVTNKYFVFTVEAA